MIWNLGSVNADYFYRVPHLPGPGETLAGTALSSGLGGKGVNQSIAAVQAGACVMHIGSVGPEGRWAKDQLASYGVDVTYIRESDVPTGHAVIIIDGNGENQIVIFSGANVTQDAHHIKTALSDALPGDWLVLQNETSCQVEAAEFARTKNMHVAYSAAPFDAMAVQAVLPFIDLLILNAVEADQLMATTGHIPEEIPVRFVLITKGAGGAMWFDNDSGEIVPVSAIEVSDVVDTTGAGDTFAGYTVAGLDQQLDILKALSRAAIASGLMVTRHGTAEVIPGLNEVLSYTA